MFSIDQNCHSLWDTLPKLQALAAHGRHVTHFVEDVDVAFTALGAGVDDSVLHLTRERFHRSGGQDWGAALFYSEFLGRLPAEIRHWEPFTGLKTSTLAKKLARDIDDLYDEFSPGDNWQLIGSSYIGDRDHHRVIGDLSVREIRCFLLDLFHIARDDMLRAFPEADAQQRLAAWFCAEEGRMAELLDEHADAGLADLYKAWLASYLDTDLVGLGVSSSLFALGADAARTALLEVFLTDYEQRAALYNDAIEETDGDLRPLAIEEGELPFFAIMDHQGHVVRCASYLRGDEILFGRQPIPLADGRRLPIDAMAEAGIRALAGKALILVIQARLGPNGQPLAMPHRGSLYMPSAHRLAAKLAEAGLLPGELKPVIRVRFHLLDRLRELDTIIRLPGHLAAAMGRAEVPARELGESWAGLAQDAAVRLDTLRSPSARTQWAKEHFPGLTAQIDALNQRRRRLAEGVTTPEEMRALWDQEKALQRELLHRTLRQIARDWQLRDLGYWDSRGALLPWSIALGGQAFYDRLLAEAEIREEAGGQIDSSGSSTGLELPGARRV